jgi:hypothetical protein
MGILNIVFGSLSLVCVVCLGGSWLVGLNTDLLQQHLGVNLVEDKWKFMNSEIPGYAAITVGGLVLGFVMGMLLLVAGIGLLYVQNWARVLSIVYGIVSLLTRSGVLVFALVLENPVEHRWQLNFDRRHPGILARADSTLANVVTVAGAALVIVYSIILLIMMFTPAVTAAYAGTPRPAEAERGWGADEGHDRDERRPADGWND